ncbi:MAG: tetratricopeptide repeat protein [Gomphosphaeria aponina SAG 52.96 = DSM 107014]|uniref:Tetratricopeptide repeat protein n=1 Tax=Gomphosphaeria aponina SAG 52.96 = DSM 107014 TaxID=1521640 RepID=A0A941JSN3_9CHRO|nr:tetratricopeptide repeat protein [Gomphosphaeria aponina SAG 52.96 = DSM 107014]
MKVFQSKYSRWIYVVLVLMLLALLGFSTLPLVTSVVQANQVQQTTNAADPQLEAQAQGYQLVLQREPDNQIALRGLLEVRLQQGNMQETIYPLERLAQLNSEQVEYSILLAQAKAQVGDYQGAEVTYREILAAHPGNMRALQGIVNLLLNQNLLEESIEVVQKTLTTAPQANLNQPNAIDVTSVQLLLGEIYASQNSYREAIAIYDQIIEREAKDFRPVLSKALVLQQQGKYDQAQPLFETAIALAPAMYHKQIQTMAAQSLAEE